MRQGLLREHPARRVALLLAAALIVGLVVLETSSSAPAQTADATTPTTVIDQCAPGVQSPAFVSYDLGAAFSGLPRTAAVQNCSPNGPPVWDGTKYVNAPASIANRTLVYGDCTTGSFEGGCSPPLEIQLWPQCGRKPALYTQTDDNGQQQPLAHTMLSLGQVASDLMPQLPSNPSTADLGAGLRQFLQGTGQLTTQLDQAISGVTPALMSELGRIPTASFGDGTQIELYTGNTTIVVFANAAVMAKTAAAALGLKLALQPGGLPSGDLMAEATSTTGCA